MNRLLATWMIVLITTIPRYAHQNSARVARPLKSAYFLKKRVMASMKLTFMIKMCLMMQTTARATNIVIIFDNIRRKTIAEAV